eukprot:TRINITY_DN1721_c0_g1_i3.p1 TRINITY_DN1721_c0_g1~~TRINITY_DN1721_c0_g1_i3.p1  ORF type:complete len:141 (-),score=60.38 TRINITY_DN1721_c0_g1_i3:69-491(-)
MIAMKVVGGELYGEIKNFKMPSDKGTIQVLASEGVWIEAGKGWSEAARAGWREGLSKILSFDEKLRPRDGKEFGELLEDMISKWPLGELKEMSTSAGIGTASSGRVKLESVREIVEEGVGELVEKEYPVWVLTDHYDSLQ